jgi:uncharacterized membrane protein
VEFFVFSWTAVSVNQDIEHIIAVLRGNPLSITDPYVQGFVNRVIWYGILPTAFGVGLFIASFALRRKALGWFWNVLLLIGGGFILYLGVSLFQFTQEYVHATSGDYITRSLQTIYSAQGWLSIFWIFVGAMLMISSIPFLARALVRELRSNRLSSSAERNLPAYD